MIIHEFETDDVVGFDIYKGKPVYRIRVSCYRGNVTPLWVGKKITVDVIRYLEDNEEYMTRVECEIVGYDSEDNKQYIHAREI